jgi:hypothetical protein
MSGRVRWGSALLAAALALGSVSGCGHDGGDDDSASSALPDAPSNGGTALAEETASGGDGTGIDVDTVATVDPDVAVDDRDIVYTASLALTVDDLAAATARVRSATIAAGGRLHDEQSRGGDGIASAALVLKVPPDRFDAVLDELASLGDVRSRSVKADDVTADVVDLEARIKSAQASVDRTRALLAQAKEIGEIVVVEAELAKRETTLEQLLGQQRVLQASVAMATITVDLTSRAAAAAEDDDGLPGPLDALAAGGRSVVAVFSVLLLALAVALPWMPVAAVALAIAWYVRRRRSGGQVATPTS